MLDLAGADADAERAEAADRRGMAVAAGEDAPGQREAEFGRDDMDDALARIVDAEMLDAAGIGVGAHQRHQLAPARIAVLVAAGTGRDDMILGRDGEFGVANRAVGALQPGKGDGAGGFLQHMAIDEDEVTAIVEPRHEMGIPDLVEER